MRYSGRTVSMALTIAVCDPAPAALGRSAVDVADRAQANGQRLLIPAYVFPADPPNHRPRWRAMCRTLVLSGARPPAAQAIIVMNPSDGDLDAMMEIPGEYHAYGEALRTCQFASS